MSTSDKMTRRPHEVERFYGPHGLLQDADHRSCMDCGPKIKRRSDSHLLWAMAQLNHDHKVGL